MAKYTIDFEDDTVTKTLTIMDECFEEEWTDNGTICERPIECQIFEHFPHLPDKEKEIIEELGSMEDDYNELLEALYELTDYEQSK